MRMGKNHKKSRETTLLRKMGRETTLGCQVTPGLQLVGFQETEPAPDEG